ncbi:MAG: hypothetical protein AB8B82_05540 [Roseovarius sp.]
MTEHKDTLEALFESARTHAPAPSAALMARVSTDAHAQQGAATAHPVPVPVSAPGLWSQIWQGLGGWPAVSGLATATCAGIWLGVYPPQTMAGMTEGLFGVDPVSPLIDMSFEGVFDLAQEGV